jgi:hypothetical protein
MARDDVQTINGLRSKIDGLIGWAREVGRPKLTTIRGLAQECGIEYSTLYSSLGSNRISSVNQGLIAKAFGFQLEWPEWREEAEVFLTKFRSVRLSGERLTVEARLTKTHLDRRMADFAFAVAGSIDEGSESKEICLVAFLSFDNRGWPVFPDLTVALKEVDIQLFGVRDGAEFEVFPLVCNGEPEGNFCSDVMGTGKGHAYWTIKVADPTNKFISGVRRRNSGRDCVCKGFVVGDEIKALMSARKIECFGTVAGKSIENSTNIKKRFIEHLVKLSVLNGAEATLAEQTLTVVHKP